MIGRGRAILNDIAVLYTLRMIWSHGHRKEAWGLLILAVLIGFGAMIWEKMFDD